MYVALACALLNPISAFAQEHPITLRVTRLVSGDVKPGDTFQVQLNADIPPGWHLYALTQPPGGPIASTIRVEPKGTFKLGAIDAPVPIVAPDPNFDITSEWHEGSATFVLPITVAKDASGKKTLLTVMGYQTCNNRYCLPPREDTLSLTMNIAALAATAPEAASPAIAPAPPADAPPADARTVVTEEQLAQIKAKTPPPSNSAVLPAGRTTGARSFLLFLWVAASMGALALLTPCVFPMVPITMSYFSQRDNRRSAVGEAGLYAFGIIGSFTILGFGLSLIFGVAGLNRFAASAPLNLGIALLFIVFALSLFGLLHLAVPSRILTALDSAGRNNRFGRNGTTLLMGATFSLTTFTCTAPFVGTLLVSAASGDWRWPAAGLFVFSSAFAVPFFVLALVPNALSKLPRSGDWLVTMKGALAFIELAAAMKFLSNADLVQGWGIFTRDVVVATWVGLGIALVLYLFGVRATRWFWRANARVHPVAGTIALLVVAWLTTGLTGRRLGELESFLPPAGAGNSGVHANELDWITDDYVTASAQAAAQNKLVLIDFTGFTCTNCRWMEANMFPRDEVQRELEQFVRVRLFTDGAGEKYRAQQRFEQEKFQTVALPLYAVVDAEGTTRATFLGMTRSADEFIKFLADARANQ